MSETSNGSTEKEGAESPVEARVDERDDLVDRIALGDTVALGELFEHATGAKVRSVKVTLPDPVSPAAAG